MYSHNQIQSKVKTHFKKYWYILMLLIQKRKLSEPFELHSTLNPGVKSKAEEIVLKEMKWMSGAILHHRVPSHIKRISWHTCMLTHCTMVYAQKEARIYKALMGRFSTETDGTWSCDNCLVPQWNLTCNRAASFRQQSRILKNVPV